MRVFGKKEWKSRFEASTTGRSFVEAGANRFCQTLYSLENENPIQDIQFCILSSSESRTENVSSRLSADFSGQRLSRFFASSSSTTCQLYHVESIEESLEAKGSCCSESKLLISKKSSSNNQEQRLERTMTDDFSLRSPNFFSQLNPSPLIQFLAEPFQIGKDGSLKIKEKR